MHWRHMGGPTTAREHLLLAVLGGRAEFGHEPILARIR